MTREWIDTRIEQRDTQERERRAAVIGAVWPLIFASSVACKPVDANHDAPPIADAPAAAAQPEPDEPFDWDKVEQRGQVRGTLRAAELADAVAREPLDPQWGLATALVIADRFADHAPPGFELISAVCRSTLCMTEIATTAGAQSPGHVSWTHVLGFPRGYVHQRDEHRIVVFFARVGHSLPAATNGR